MWVYNFFENNSHIHYVKRVRIRSYSGPHFSRIFLHSDWIRRDTSVFSPDAGKWENTGKMGVRINPNTDSFYAVIAFGIMSRCNNVLIITAWKVFKYGAFVVCILLYSVRIQKNMDQKKLRTWHLSRSACKVVNMSLTDLIGTEVLYFLGKILLHRDFTFFSTSMYSEIALFHYVNNASRRLYYDFMILYIYQYIQQNCSWPKWNQQPYSRDC